MNKKILHFTVYILIVSTLLVSCGGSNYYYPNDRDEPDVAANEENDSNNNDDNQSNMTGNNINESNSGEAESQDQDSPKNKTDILLIDNWADGDSDTEEALDSKGANFDAATKSEIGQSDFDFNDYRVVITNQWWNKNTTKTINENANEIKAYVENGGVFVLYFSLLGNCDIENWTSSWSPYQIYVELLTDRNCGSGGGYEQAIIAGSAENHPIFKGFDNEFTQLGESAGFVGLDNNWIILAWSEESGAPMIVEAEYGDGLFLVVIPNTAYKYNQVFNNTLLFDNIINYALANAK